jgi:hypothetical protein
MTAHPGKGVRNGGTSGCGINCSRLSGGLRYAATTGYYLASFQADAMCSHSCLLLVEFPARVQIIEVQDRVEDEEVASFSLPAPHWVG